MAVVPNNIVAILGVDNAGAITNIDPNLVFNKQVEVSAAAAIITPVEQKKEPKAPVTPTEPIVTETIISLIIDALPTNIPMVNKDQDNLETSTLWQVSKRIGVNTKSPRWLFDVNGGSINITPITTKDGYKINNLNLAYADFTTAGSEFIYFGDDTYLPIANFKKLLIRGLIPTAGTETGIDRILFINDLGVVTAKTDVFLESLNGLTKKVQVFAFGTSGTTPNVVSSIISTVATHTFNFPMAATASVTAGLISKAQYDIFNAKEPAIALGTTAQYYRGDKSWQSFNDAARAAVSAGTGISYNSTTGVISYSGTVYTDATIRALISAGTGISINGSGVISFTGSIYTDTSIRNLFSITVNDAANATYTPSTGIFNIPTINGVAAGGQLTGTYPNPSLLESAVISKKLANLPASTTGSINSDDTILSAFSKTQTQLNSLAGAVIYKGTWNASTNNPTITSSVGTQGNYYIVNVAGTTTINGISSWAIGDWIIYNGTAWQKVDNAATVYTAGTGITITSGVIATTITQYTNTDARGAISAGTGIAYNSGTGVISSTITQYTDTLARGAFSAGTGISITSGGVISSTITQVSTADIRAAISAGTGITYNNSTGVIAYSGTVYTDTSIRALISAGTGITYNSATGVIASSITQFTTTDARNAISAGTGITYNSATGVIASSITQFTTADARNAISAGTGITYNSATGVIASSITQFTTADARNAISAGTGITYNSATGVIAYSGTVYTDSTIRGLVSGGTGITYNNSTGAFTCTITQYTNTDARGAISLTTTGTSGAATYTSSTGVLNIPQYQGGVTSFNTRTGAVSLTSLDVTNALTFTPYSNTNPNGYTSNTGTVTSIGLTSNIGLTFSAAITTNGTINVGNITDFIRISSLGVGVAAPTTTGKIEASGDIVAFSASDIRLKKDVSILENATEMLSKLRGVSYLWDEQSKEIHGYSGKDYGVIAQDVQKIFPEMVQERENGYLSVRYEKLIGVLVAAINEQNKRIKYLESKI